MRDKRIIIGVFVIALAGLGILGLCRQRDRIVQIKVLGIEKASGLGTNQLAGGKSIKFLMTNSSSSHLYFFSHPRVQARVQHRWLESQEILGWDCGLRPATNSAELLVVVPAQANACRFVLKYRTGGNPVCKAYGWLQKMGIYPKYQKTCRWLVRFIPRDFGCRQIVLEVNV